MWNLVRCITLAVGVLVMTACSSNATIYQLKNVVNKGEATIVVTQNDKLIINATADAPQWWHMTPDKNAAKHLSFELHKNKRQHTLTFDKQGEFTVTSTTKDSSGQGAQMSRVLTFVVE